MATDEAPPVDDIWKAAAYGDLDKLKQFLNDEPNLVNKPDATGYVPLDPPAPHHLSSWSPPFFSSGS